MPGIARLGDPVYCPRCGWTRIVSGSSHLCDNKPVACVGDKTACGSTIVQGSSQATADGKPVAYVGAKTSHGGTILSGSRNTVLR